MMKHYGLVAVVALLSGNAAAEWTPVGGTDEIFTAYADADGIRRDGTHAHMAGLYDFKRGDISPQGRVLFSTTVQREYDCAASRVRLLAHVDHSGRMGEGAAVGTGSVPGRWEQIVPGALDEAFWKIACGAR